jgi:hypothetical protein
MGAWLINVHHAREPISCIAKPELSEVTMTQQAVERYVLGTEIEPPARK